ncbi:Ig-like domain-containing protein [Anaeromicropila herbilytica]|uniref:BIG2 domain-containing protein n=1 Tax=Anaeromicropila herbilytica TaxID=2785025 RepID=A0A7R7EQC0_9FIRM|nr:Ig-like domain-containing protein [Anaeromicropila herbilytica]BCN32582.1 hypothetical protein bsdtb5_38770 [Anaeromicropila herbilytica]
MNYYKVRWKKIKIVFSFLCMVLIIGGFSNRIAHAETTTVMSEVGSFEDPDLEPNYDESGEVIEDEKQMKSFDFSLEHESKLNINFKERDYDDDTDEFTGTYGEDFDVIIYDENNLEVLSRLHINSSETEDLLIKTSLSKGKYRLCLVNNDIMGLDYDFTIKAIRIGSEGDPIYTLKNKSMTLSLGDTTDLTVVTEPSTISGYSVIWESSDDSVVSVSSNGVVKGNQKGTATITATIGKTKLSCKVTVKNPSINKSKVTLYLGSSTTLLLSHASGTTKWSSSSPSVATISPRGKVIAKKKGTTTITVISNGIKLSCKVTVKNPTISKTKVSITNGYSATLKIAHATGDVRWASSNKSIATVSPKGKVTAKKIGTTTITATVKGRKLQCKVVVKRAAPDFLIDLYEYRIRTNTFYITVHNYGKKTLRIYSSGAYSLDYDYKTYDRYLKLSGNRNYIDLKPGKSKSVNFAVIGSTTWFDRRTEVYFIFSYDGKYYRACGCYTDDGYYYNGKKWVESYKSID